MAKGMDKGDYTSLMEATTKDNGIKIAWKVSENCIMPQEHLLSKAIGKQMSFTELEEYSTTNVSLIKVSLITLISEKSERNGYIMKASSSMTPSTDEGQSSYPQGSYLKVSLITMWWRVSVHLQPQLGNWLEDFGRTTSS